MNWQDFEKAIFGKASIPPGTPTAPAPPQAPSAFRRNLNWIKVALGLQSGNPPQDLDTNRIVAYLDAFQDGWPFALYQVTQTIVTVGGTALLAIDPAAIRRVIAIQAAYHDVAAVGAPIPLVLRSGPWTNFATGANILVGVSQFTIAPLGEAETIDILQSRPLFVPAGTTLFLNGTIPALNDVTVSIVTASVPTGFRP